MNNIQNEEKKDTENEKNPRFDIQLIISNGIVTIRSNSNADKDTRILVDLEEREVRSVINLLSCIIDEDIPSIIKNNELGDSDYTLNMKMSLPYKDMIVKDEE